MDELYSAMRAMNEPFQSKDDARAEMQKMDKDGSMTIDFLVGKYAMTSLLLVRIYGGAR